MIENYETDEPVSAALSSGVSRRGLFAAGTALGAAAALGAPSSAVAATLTTDTGYTPDANPELKNPERGMYFGNPPGSTGFHTLVRRWLYLDSVCHTDLAWHGLNDPRTSGILKLYAQGLQDCRDAGVKVIFRPRYDVKGTSATKACTVNGVTVFHADTKARQLNHIDAIAKMLRENRDVIAVIQAGYLGRYGEWHSSGSGFTKANAPLLYNEPDRREILDRILSAYGGGTSGRLLQPVELRRPIFAEEARRRNSNANVGLYNDCFMSNTRNGLFYDFGTYVDFPGSPVNRGGSVADQQKHWIDKAKLITTTKSFGGETCPINDSTDSEYKKERWRSCASMRSEPAMLHMNYLHGEHAPEAVPTWKAGGCYDEIRRKLGYRFEVTKVEYTKTVAAGQNFAVTIDIKNTGWARLHKPRRAQLFLRKASTSWTTPLGYLATDSAGQTRNWAPGSTTRVTYTGVAPAAGTYSLHLAIFDPDATVVWNQPERDKAEWRYHYAVKLASKRSGVNIFNASTGMNDLGISITAQ